MSQKNKRTLAEQTADDPRVSESVRGEVESGRKAPVGPQKADGMRQAIRVIDVFLVVLVLAVAGYGIFELPYQFPVQVPMFDTPSYNVGFNNSVAVLAVALGVGLLFLSGQWTGHRLGTWSDAFFETLPRPMSWRSSALLVFMSFTLGVAYLFLFRFMPRIEEFAETPDWLMNMKLTLNYGQHPYRDFEFSYGPLMHYLPTLISGFVEHVLGGRQISGYVVSLLVSLWVGLWAIWYVLDQIRIRQFYRDLIFGAIALATFDYTFAVASTLLRYATPYALSFWMHRRVLAEVARGERARPVFLGGLFLGAAFAMFCISLEFGFVFCAALGAYALQRLWVQGRLWLGALAASLIAIPLWMLLFPASLDRVLGGGKGFSSMPIVPAAFIVFYLGTLFWLLPVGIRKALEKSSDHAPLVAALVVMMLGVTPASLGRCEHHHVMTNGLGAFVMALALLAWRDRRAFSLYFATYGLIFVVVWRAVDILDFGFSLNPLRAALGGSAPGPAPAGLQADLKLDSCEPRSVAIPQGVDRATRDYLVESGRLSPQFYMKFGSVATRKELDRKVQELGKAKYVLVPKQVLNFRGIGEDQIRAARLQQLPQTDAYQSSWMGTLFLWPMKIQSRNLPFDPVMEESVYLANHYQVLREARDHVLLVANSSR